jgi:GNAT superfamily N-acetyltransferase
VNWAIEALSGTHVRDHFRCGQSSLDDYIRKFAGQHSRKNVGRTFVAVAPGARQVLGYYTLSSSSVAFEHAPPKIQQKLPRYPIPVALLGKLGVDQSVQGQGLGGFLLMDALQRIVEVAEEIAIFAVEVHALNASAEAFYLKYGFQPFQEQPSHLFLPLVTIKNLF